MNLNKSTLELSELSREGLLDYIDRLHTRCDELSRQRDEWIYRFGEKEKYAEELWQQRCYLYWRVSQEHRAAFDAGAWRETLRKEESEGEGESTE